ncbi:MAG: hypothetical protein HXY48_09830 [Ignavibacteriaceae bacterium]|nr:hypothetical protein [Ignavibacteriaceae bacterium]
MLKNIFKLVMPFFFLMLVAFSQNSFAQLSGSYTIPGTPFATVKSAIDSLNLVGVGSGGVTINVTAGYTESVSDSVFILTATGTVSSPIVFQKSGAGSNPLITRTDAGTKTTSTFGGQGDAVIIIQGSDYVTFDGIDVAADQSTIEYGYYLRKVDGTDGCKYVTIKNSVIDMTKGTSAYVIGIYSSNNNPGSLVSSATGITVTSTGGRNEFVTLTGNTIQDVHIGITLRGFNHTVAPNDFQDYNFVVGASGEGNIIQNFGGGSTSTNYGIYLINHTNPTVSYNTINNAGGGGVNSTGQIYGIFMSATSASVNRGGDVVMNNNNITISTSATGAVSSINIAPISTSVTVSNNTFSFGSFTSTASSQIINVAQNTPTVTITGNQNSGAITKTGVGQLNCINYFGSPVNGVVTIANNNFSNISLTGTSVFNGILASGSSTATIQTYNNTISNITIGTGTSYGIQLSTALVHQAYNNTIHDITAGGILYGISFSGTNPSVYNNTVYNLTTSGATLIGINDQGSQTTNCYKNQIYNLTSTYSSTAAMNVSGIQITTGTVGNYVYNNFISDIKIPNATVTTNALFGINASASGATAKIRLYYNTIYLNSTGTGYKSYAIFSNSGHNAELRNNIAVNTSGGFAVAYGRSTSSFGTYSNASDNNDFFAANIFHDGTTYYTTLADYQTLVYPRDQATFSENPPFVNVTTAPYDLRINTTIATQTERGGRPVSSPITINEDFDGNLRDGSFPDVGADEFSGTALDLTAPIIVYNPFDNTSSLSDRTLIANISDQTGVPTAAPGWPNLYWKKVIAGTYSAVQPTTVSGSDYTFNFGSGVVPGDTVYYYIVAQDGAGTPNVRAFPTIGAGNYTTNPPAAGTPPTTPYSYNITNSSLSGDYTVGTALFSRITGRTITFEKSGDKLVPMENGQRYYGDLYAKKIEHPEYNYPDGTDGVYLTLTAAIADLNLRGVSGPVNFLLTDASYTSGSGETFPLVVNITNEFKPTFDNIVIIKPNFGVTSLIQGMVDNSVIIKIFSDYVNINGSNSYGMDRSLTIENTSTTNATVVLFGSSGTSAITNGSIRNCNVINGTNNPNVSFKPAVFVGDSSSTLTSGYFSNITIENNAILKSAIGIQCSGVTSSGNGNGLFIGGNSLNDTTANSIGNIGIQISGVDGALITNNSIGNIITPVSGGSLPTGIFIGSQTVNSTISNNTIGPINITSTSSGPVGISISTGNANSNLVVRNNTITGLKLNQPAVVQGLTVGGLTGGVLITKNRIYDIKNTDATSGYGAYAISLGSSLTAANITLSNNFIWDIAAYGRNSLTFHNGYGMYITGGGGYNIYHNTISLSTDQTLVTGLPACINIGSGVTTASSLDIRNNILANFETVGTDRYAIICNAASSVFAYIDNNDYYTTGSNLGYLGSNRADLAAWQIATGKDVNSVSADPGFISSTDLHINTSSLAVSNNGFYLSAVQDDIDGDVRNNPPDIGADEYNYILPGSSDPTNVIATAINDTQIDVAFTPNASNNNVVIVFNTWGTFETPSGPPPAIGDWFAGGTLLANSTTSPYSHTGLNPNTTYYYKLFSYDGTYYSPGVEVNATTLVPPPGESYAYNGGLGSYGTINLTTGAFTSWNLRPQGNAYYPATADNDSLNSHYVIMSDFSFPSNYYLWHVSFAPISADSIAPVGPLVSGQNMIKGMAYNSVNNTWYVVSGNDFGSAAYLYTINITTGALTVVGQIQNANLPVGIAINCDGTAYIINVVFGTSSTAVLNSLNLTTAVATAIGTDLGLANVTGFSQDMDFNPDNGNLYWSGYWSSGFFSEGGSFRLLNITNGTSTQISTFGQFETITGFNVNGICPAVSTFQLSVDVTNGWNMVSIPGLHPVNQNVNTWWQYKDPGADVFKFLSGYQIVTDAVPGIGYWMKNAGDRTYNTGEEWPAGGIQTVAHDPLTAQSGWNLIGGYELSVQTANITTNPSGLQSGPVFKYSSGYQVAATLVPGYGYWIKLDAAGQIIIPETMAKGTEQVEYFSKDWGRITLTDAAGVTYTLYSVNGNVDLSQYDLPPAPPAGMYDFRFSSGRIAENLNDAVQTIEMSGVVYPLTVRVEGMDIRLMDETGKTINVNLKAGEDVVITDATINKLMVAGGSMPTVYSLEQNYPNPFNPSTVIEFSLPENVGNVQLSIYNALGEKVAELVNTALTAGKYKYQWNASNVATGMYIYELRTDKFVSVKKMLLLK